MQLQLMQDHLAWQKQQFAFTCSAYNKQEQIIEIKDKRKTWSEAYVS